MLRKEICVLAVNPGTKYLGLAVFQGSDLIYWGTKVLRGKWSIRKLRNAEKLLLDIIDRYGITVLSLKRVHPSRTSTNLRSLIASIEGLAEKRGLTVHRYELGDLKRFFAASPKANKMTVLRLALAQYQFLGDQIDREEKHKHPYFIRMFEAIAAGILAFNRFDR
jgi:hypothetical protein